MAENEGTGGAPVLPQTFGQKIVFGVPAILVAFVLAVVAAFILVTITNNKTREELSASFKNELSELDRKNAEKLKETNSAREALQIEVKAMVEKTVRLEEEKKSLAENLTKAKDGIEKVSSTLSDFVKGQEALDQTQFKDIASTKKDLNELDKKVHYIEEKLKKLDEIAADVNGLKTDTAGLKEQYVTLKSDMKTVSQKADITEKDLADLSERARLFQLRVLAARAREAADAARTMDLKNLLNRLDDVEDTK